MYVGSLIKDDRLKLLNCAKWPIANKCKIPVSHAVCCQFVGVVPLRANWYYSIKFDNISNENKILNIIRKNFEHASNCFENVSVGFSVFSPPSSKINIFKFEVDLFLIFITCGKTTFKRCGLSF